MIAKIIKIGIKGQRTGKKIRRRMKRRIAASGPITEKVLSACKCTEISLLGLFCFVCFRFNYDLIVGDRKLRHNRNRSVLGALRLLQYFFICMRKNVERNVPYGVNLKSWHYLLLYRLPEVFGSSKDLSPRISLICRVKSKSKNRIKYQILRFKD
jgi:hypothetical protein